MTKAKTPKPEPAAKTPLSATVDDALLDVWWQNPGDLNALRVLADAWVERSDPRGEFVQLSLLEQPTVDQTARRESLLKRLGGALVGPARPFLREWEFGPQGVVTRARCEAELLAQGAEYIGRLNPLLFLCVTSLKKKSVAEALSKVSLKRLHFVGFTMNIIGSLGGSNVSDPILRIVAPAFRGVKNLALQVRGQAKDCFGPDGLRELANHLEGVEYLHLDHSPYRVESPVPPVGAYEDVIMSHPAFESLRGVVVEGGDAERLKTLPNVVSVIVHNGLRAAPRTAEALAAFKARG